MTSPDPHQSSGGIGLAWNISHRDFLMHPPPEILTIN